MTLMVDAFKTETGLAARPLVSIFAAVSAATRRAPPLATVVLSVTAAIPGAASHFERGG
jgi:hypothetical protein